MLLLRQVKLLDFRLISKSEYVVHRQRTCFDRLNNGPFTDLVVPRCLKRKQTKRWYLCTSTENVVLQMVRFDID